MPPTMLGRPVALPFAAQLFTGVTYVNFSTSSLPSLRRLAVHKVGWLGVRPLGSSLSLRRLAAHHVGPARGVAPRRTVIRRLYRRVALRHRPRCPVDGWPPTTLGWPGAQPSTRSCSLASLAELIVILIAISMICRPAISRHGLAPSGNLVLHALLPLG